jgi:hypothetical protein
MSQEAVSSNGLSVSKPIPKGLKPWQPGQSGNPGGKPKRFSELTALSKANFPLAVKRLGELIQSKDEEMAFRAVQFAFLYLLGKPADSMVYLEALKARLADYEAQVPGVAQHVEEQEAVSPLPVVPAQLTREEPQAPLDSPLSQAPPEPPVATPVGGEALGFTMTPERQELLEQVKPEPKATEHRCLYRTATGQCEDVATDGRWCATHRAKLFNSLEAK